MPRPRSRNRESIPPFPAPDKWRIEELRIKGRETWDEIKARIVREERSARHRDLRESFTFLAIIAITVAACLIGFWIVIHPDYSPES